MSAVKCQSCNNVTTNPSGYCYLHETARGSGPSVSDSNVASVPTSASIQSEETLDRIGELTDPDNLKHMAISQQFVDGNIALVVRLPDADRTVYLIDDPGSKPRPDGTQYYSRRLMVVIEGGGYYLDAYKGGGQGDLYADAVFVDSNGQLVYESAGMPDANLSELGSFPSRLEDLSEEGGPDPSNYDTNGKNIAWTVLPNLAQSGQMDWLYDHAPRKYSSS